MLGSIKKVSWSFFVPLIRTIYDTQDKAIWKVGKQWRHMDEHIVPWGRLWQSRLEPTIICIAFHGSEYRSDRSMDAAIEDGHDESNPRAISSIQYIGEFIRSHPNISLHIIGHSSGGTVCDIASFHIPNCSFYGFNAGAGIGSVRRIEESISLRPRLSKYFAIVIHGDLKSNAIIAAKHIPITNYDIVELPIRKSNLDPHDVMQFPL